MKALSVLAFGAIALFAANFATASPAKAADNVGVYAGSDGFAIYINHYDRGYYHHRRGCWNKWYRRHHRHCWHRHYRHHHSYYPRRHHRHWRHRNHWRDGDRRWRKRHWRRHRHH